MKSRIKAKYSTGNTYELIQISKGSGVMELKENGKFIKYVTMAEIKDNIK